MLTRTLLAWVGFSALLTVLASVTQAREFEISYIGWSVFFSIPIAFSAYRGAIGTAPDGSLNYPSIGFSVLSAWILGVAPSLIVDASDSLASYSYTDLGLSWARALFLLWCLTFAITTATPHEGRVRVQIGIASVSSMMASSAFILAYLIQAGLFSNYGGHTRSSLEAGGLLATFKSFSIPLVAALPAFSLLSYCGAKSAMVRLVSSVCFVTSCIGVLLSGGRSTVVFALVVCLFLCRKFRLKFRLGVVLATLASMPLLFVLIFTYRQSLARSADTASSISDYVTAAMDSTESVAQDDTARSDAIDASNRNVRTRLWYGPQFCATVDEWLDNGSEWRGSLLSGLIRSAPTWMFPGKNAIADGYEMERLLIATGRYANTDLAPMPWQQWLFEFGIPGLLFGAVLYGLLARTIDRRLSQSNSYFEALFWLTVSITICAPEHTTDGLVLVARTIAVFIMGVATIAFVLGLFLRESIDTSTQRLDPLA